MHFSAVYSSPVGEILIVCDDEAVCEVKFLNQSDLKRINENSPLLNKVCNWFDDYFNAENPEIDFKLKTEGSEFRQKVWKLLAEIPYGKPITYGEIASKISPTMSAQAVGGAVSCNPIPILIPCHRVLGVNAKLTGYSGGLERKMKLLDLENIKYSK